MRTDDSHIIGVDDKNVSDTMMSDTMMSDTNTSDSDMSKINVSWTFWFGDNMLSNISKTWLHYLNGPNSGSIDFELARREMPWLAGVTQQLTFRPFARRDWPLWD